MAFESVPLAIGNGAVHSDDIMRVGNNIYTQDASGINLPHHFKVRATSPASMGVIIGPGGMTLRNAQWSGHSYVGEARDDTPVTGLTAGTSHLIMARIVDPQYDPWQPSGTPGAPNTSVANGPYFQPYVLGGVGNTTRLPVQAGITYTAEPLARVDIPAGATSITQGMITDLRRLARPRFWTESDVQQQTQTNYVTTAETAWHDWPLNSLQVDIPTWATDAVCSIRYGFKVSGACDVDARVALGNLTPGSPTIIDYNAAPGTPVGSVEVLQHETFAKFDVTGIQGQTVSLRPQARRNPTYATVNTGDIWGEATQQVALDIRFKEQLR